MQWRFQGGAGVRTPSGGIWHPGVPGGVGRKNKGFSFVNDTKNQKISRSRLSALAFLFFFHQIFSKNIAIFQNFRSLSLKISKKFRSRLSALAFFNFCNKSTPGCCNFSLISAPPSGKILEPPLLCLWSIFR